MALDILSGWLEQYPEALYSGYTMGMPTGRKDFYSGQYSDVYQNYMGNLANQITQGKTPTLSWADFLKDYDWSKEWGGASPSDRGERQTVYNPARQWRVW